MLPRSVEEPVEWPLWVPGAEAAAIAVVSVHFIPTRVLPITAAATTVLPSRSLACVGQSHYLGKWQPTASCPGSRLGQILG